MSNGYGDCDCCSRHNMELTQCWVNGLETWACTVCMGEDEEEGETECQNQTQSGNTPR